MEKYKICPCCGAKNVTTSLECNQCETDLSGVRVIDDSFINNNEIDNSQDEEIRYVKICDCGKVNNVTASICESCGEIIDDIIPSVYQECTLDCSEFHLISVDGEYDFCVCKKEIIGRENKMQEYLHNKMFVSRCHAELNVDKQDLYITNLSGTNFTYVNDIKIPEGPFKLTDGDEIGLGGNKCNGLYAQNAAYFVVKEIKCI